MDYREPEFAAIAADWSALVGRAAEESSAEREARIEQVAREHHALVSAGKWVSGPSDLLGILGRDRDELIHSRLLAWLLNPTARHELGDGFLRLLLGEMWPEFESLALDAVITERELDRVVFDDTTGQRYQARADVVVRVGGLTIVIENKLDAVEGPIQCERLYRAWHQEPGETRWLLISPSGREPASVVTTEAAQAWKSVSYRKVSDWLSESIENAGPNSSLGRASALQYLASVRRRYPPKHPAGGSRD